jgi:hypothetical protein
MSGVPSLQDQAFAGSPRAAWRCYQRIRNPGDRDRWLGGVALGATGRYGEALGLLATVSGGWASLALSTSASVCRQVGRHAEGRQLDEGALAAADSDDARFDATLGLAADAVGLGELDVAQEWWAGARAVCPDEWRPRARMAWVETEIALLAHRPGDAVEAAARAVRLSEASPRHRAKGELFEGVARSVAGENAAVLLRRSHDRATSVGAWPLVWPAASVLAGLLGAEAGRPWRSRAAVVAASIGTGLPAAWRAGWVADRSDLNR